jgi:peptide/nickel transport system substrate-binding protein
MTDIPRPRRPRWRALGVLAIAVGTAGSLALAGCSSSGPGSSSGSASAAAGTPVSGGTLTFAVSSDAGCVDPQQVGSNDTIYSMRQIVDSLTDQDPVTGKIVPWLAKSWTVTDNATTFTFSLRPGVTFSDGTPLTAQVVKDNFEAIPNLGVLGLLGEGYLAGLSSITVEGPLTVRIRFRQPDAQFLQATSTFSLGIESEASIKESPAAKCANGVIGSGPFVLSKYVPNQSITLVRRQGYDWGSSLWANQGPAYLSKLVFDVIPESGVRTGSLESGQVDAIGSVGLADEAALKAAGVQLEGRANPGVVFNIGLNNSRPLFRDIKVRQAIDDAIDRQQIASTVFPTGTQPATSILSHTTPDYENLASDLTYDQAKAKALLASDGWKAGPGGTLEKDGTPLSFTIDWGDNAATNQPALELIQQQLKAIGINVALQEVPVAKFADVIAGGDFDAFWANLTRADPDILRTNYSTLGLNFYHLPGGELTTILTEQAETTSAAARQQLVDEAQQLIVSNAYAIPVVELQTELGVAKDVHNLDFEASSRIQLHDTWIS